MPTWLSKLAPYLLTVVVAVGAAYLEGRVRAAVAKATLPIAERLDSAEGKLADQQLQTVALKATLARIEADVTYMRGRLDDALDHHNRSRR